VEVLPPQGLPQRWRTARRCPAHQASSINVHQQRIQQFASLVWQHKPSSKRTTRTVASELLHTPPADVSLKSMPCPLTEGSVTAGLLPNTSVVPALTLSTTVPTSSARTRTLQTGRSMLVPYCDNDDIQRDVRGRAHGLLMVRAGWSATSSRRISRSSRRASIHLGTTLVIMAQLVSANQLFTLINTCGHLRRDAQPDRTRRQQSAVHIVFTSG
jgi:hypothetical protein